MPRFTVSGLSEQAIEDLDAFLKTKPNVDTVDNGTSCPERGPISGARSPPIDWGPVAPALPRQWLELIDVCSMTMRPLMKLKTCSLLALACCLTIACHPPVKNVSTDAGSGSRRGSPPLCFDYRGEAQATGEAGISNIWAYLNNTCSYTVNCDIYDDVTEQQHPVGVLANKQLRFLIAASAPATKVRLKLECSWNP